ncbi:MULTISPECIES: hypothetical protein [unclassified Roseateles]|uniref:hypothetical protein n=1 Tax=unclassified Roseateles TaxID=2626991 RepID=UPI0006FA0444|nr:MULTISPECIES: hypothetical protein [unclassified Roseateles]KQW49674.1 hypothetical protein ASC81_25615 [Pelomonas sp. Root405]KRA76133.1 hypothetical protein ASD88_25565 [Pelomonas sp. Root662]
MSVQALDGGGSAVRSTPVTRDPAAEVVGRATDPRTGQVDTQRLAGWVVDARRSDPQNAETAHAAIERNLLDSGRLVELGHYHEDLRQAAAAGGTPPAAAAGADPIPGAGLWAAGQGMVQGGGQVLRDNPILVKQWEATTSAWTGRGGFTRGLTQLLNDGGIQIAPGVNASPPGSLGRTSGVPSAVANNTNGSLARDAIADRWRAAGADVRVEVPVQNGARVVDVVVQPPAADPRMAQRIEIESKVGRTGLGSSIRGQVAHDVERLQANRTIRGGGQLLENVGRVARPVGVVLDAISLTQAYKADGNRIGENTGRTASGVAGGALGGWGGAAAGAAIGTAIFPGVGTVVGGVVGGIAGAFAGDTAGKGIFDTVKGWF